MLEQRERIQYLQPSDATLTLNLISVKVPWNPPWCDTCNANYISPVYVRSMEKLITDDDGDHTKWKPCQHYKCWMGPAGPDSYGIPWQTRNGSEIPVYKSTGGLPALNAWDDGRPQLAFGAPGIHFKNLPALYQADTGDGFVPKPANLSLMVDASLKAMLPSVKEEMSLINSLIELRDFKSLPNTLRDVRDWTRRIGISGSDFTKRFVGSFNGRIRSTFNRSYGPTLHETLRVGSDAYLAFKFAIAPLLSDIAGVYSAIYKTSGRINDLVVRQGKRRVKHFSLQVPIPTNPSHLSQDSTAYSLALGNYTGSAVNPQPPGSSPCYRGNRLGLIMNRELLPGQIGEFHAQIEYNYHFTRYQTENAQWLGMLDALGVNLNPSIIWNALPWTFVVDWVVDVGRFLDSYKVQNMAPVINISRYLWSWKQFRIIRANVRSTGVIFTGCNPMARTYLPDLYESAYRRDVSIPSRSSLITSGLSSNEFSLAAALVVVKRTRRPNLRIHYPKQQ